MRLFPKIESLTLGELAELEEAETLGDQHGMTVEDVLATTLRGDDSSVDAHSERTGYRIHGTVDMIRNLWFDARTLSTNGGPNGNRSVGDP